MSCWRTFYSFTSTDSELRLPGTPIALPDEPNVGTFSTLQEYFDESFTSYLTQFQSLTAASTPVLNIESPQAAGYPYAAVAERTAVMMRRLRALYPWWTPACYGLHVTSPWSPFITLSPTILQNNAACEASLQSVVERIDIDGYARWYSGATFRYGWDPAQKLDEIYSWILYTYPTILDAYIRYGSCRIWVSPIIVGSPTQKRVALSTWSAILVALRRWCTEGLISEIVLFDGWDTAIGDEEVWSTVKSQTTTSLSSNTVKSYTEAAYIYATANP